MIYFDNGATTFPKPLSVADEVRRCINVYGGNPGRSGHTMSVAAARKVFECREVAAELLGVGESERIFFTPNATYGINAVLKGLLKLGDQVLISDLEHNAVWRPVHKMAMEGKITYDIFRTFAEEGELSQHQICSEIGRLLRPQTRMVFCTHSSNICSAVLPLKEIGEFCNKARVMFCVDGAQTAGHEPINIDEMKIDALCLPGHKGLYGPQGSGLVALGRDVILDTLTEGGNGVESLSPLMPEETPERYESGTVSTPCIAGLGAGIRAVKERGVENISKTEKQLTGRLKDALGGIRGVDVYAPWFDGSILLFNVRNIPSERIAAELDRRGICVRAGYHCAGLAHRTLGTPDGGAVRVSVGMFNKISEIDTLSGEVLSIVRSLR